MVHLNMINISNDIHSFVHLNPNCSLETEKGCKGNFFTKKHFQAREKNYKSFIQFG